LKPKPSSEALSSSPRPLEGAGAASEASDRTSFRRAQVLEATVRVISERGIERTRLVDVARSAQVSIGLIQHYFESRDELLASSFDFFNDIWIREWEKVSKTDADPPHKLMELLRLCAFEFEGWHEVQWRIWVEFWSLCNRNPNFRAHYSTIYDKFRSPFREVLAEGVARGDFVTRSSVEDIVDRVTAQIEGLRVHALLEPERVSRQRMFELLLAEVQDDLGFSFPAAADRARQP
jgi:TetR/AcrR family transcriptional regulator, transcriptional repressor of bet genes